MAGLIAACALPENSVAVSYLTHSCLPVTVVQTDAKAKQLSQAKVVSAKCSTKKIKRVSKESHTKESHIMCSNKRLRAVHSARIAGPSAPFGRVTLLGVSVLCNSVNSVQCSCVWVVRWTLSRGACGFRAGVVLCAAFAMRSILSTVLRRNQTAFRAVSTVTSSQENRRQMRM